MDLLTFFIREDFFIKELNMFGSVPPVTEEE